MKILFVCRSFVGVSGGVERMSIRMMNEMRARGHTVHLLTWDLPGHEGSFFDMDPRIVWHRIGLGDPRHKAGWKTRLLRLFAVRKIMREYRPDVAIGFQHGPFIAARLYGFGLGIPMICAERNAPDRMDFSYLNENRNFVFQTMRLASAITIQMESYRAAYPAFLRNRIVTIPNPVDLAVSFSDPAGLKAKRKKILSVGRLAYQKNYPCLIRAFSLLADSYADWDLEIIGEGEDREGLVAIIDSLELSARVFLLGAMPPDKVAQAYCQAHVFALPSRWEGFPNVLAEAMAHGLPTVGFAGCAGVRDLIENGVNGVLAEGQDNEKTLAESLATLMDDPDARVRMGEHGTRSMQSYKPSLIFDKWEKLFLKLSEGRRP